MGERPRQETQVYSMLLVNILHLLTVMIQLIWIISLKW